LCTFHVNTLSGNGSFGFTSEPPLPPAPSPPLPPAPDDSPRVVADCPQLSVETATNARATAMVPAVEKNRKVCRKVMVAKDIDEGAEACRMF
jgi:hypothetical protein